MNCSSFEDGVSCCKMETISSKGANARAFSLGRFSQSESAEASSADHLLRSMVSSPCFVPKEHWCTVHSIKTFDTRFSARMLNTECRANAQRVALGKRQRVRSEKTKFTHYTSGFTAFLSRRTCRVDGDSKIDVIAIGVCIPMEMPVS